MSSGLVMLSPHFSLPEMLASAVAERLHINNAPTLPIITNLERTAQLLESVRTLLGNKPILILSGYRCPALNRAIKGSDTSAHMLGLAVDFHCPKFGNPLAICNAILTHGKLPFDQLIYEFGSWVHLGLCEGRKPRGEVLTVDKKGVRHGLQAIRR